MTNHLPSDDEAMHEDELEKLQKENQRRITEMRNRGQDFSPSLVPSIVIDLIIDELVASGLISRVDFLLRFERKMTEVLDQADHEYNMHKLLSGVNNIVPPQGGFRP